MRHLVNSFLDRLSTILLVFGGALLAVGVAVQIGRAVQMRTINQDRSAPTFEDTLQAARVAAQERQIAPAMPSESSAPVAALSPPTRIVIPSVKIDTPVVEVGWEARIVNGEEQGNVWQTADFAAGHHKFSAMPGYPGNLVISGHNNLQGAVFRNLYKTVPGDQIYVYTTAGQRYAYEVAESFVVPEEDATPEQRRDNTHWIRPTVDERLTLVTCFPPWSNTHRAIVLALPVSDQPPSTAGGTPAE